MSTQITLANYWMGRDKTHPMDLSTLVYRNAEVLVSLINKLLPLAEADGVKFEIHPRTKSIISGGWRPPAINSSTKGAAVNSKHITGQAVDVYDPDGDFDEWLISERGIKALEQIGLWIEHPASTKGWTHLQSVPPGSKRRVFYP